MMDEFEASPAAVDLGHTLPAEDACVFSRGVVKFRLDGQPRKLERTLRVTMAELGLAHYQSTFVDSGVNLEILLDMPGPVMLAELQKLGMKLEDVKRLRSALLTGERVANAWEASRIMSS